MTTVGKQSAIIRIVLSTVPAFIETLITNKPIS